MYFLHAGLVIPASLGVGSTAIGNMTVLLGLYKQEF